MLTQTKHRRLLQRAESQLDKDPVLALASVQQLLDGDELGRDTQVLKARALVRCGRFLEAAMLLEKIVGEYGGDASLHTLWINTLLSAGAYSKLEKLIKGLGDISSAENFEFLNAVVTASRFVGETESTKSLVEAMLEKFPGKRGLIAQLGITCQSLGETEQAESCYREAVKQDGGRGLSCYFLSYNNKWNVEKNNIQALRENLQQDATTGFDKALKFYALAKELEDLKQYDEAFAYYQQGAALAGSLVPYSVDADRRFFEAVKKGFSEFDGSEIHGYDGDNPIFILGMPRTGSTLIDTIISSHPEVYSVGELLTFREVVKLFSGYPGGGRDIEKFYQGLVDTRLDFSQLGQMYSTLARVSAAKGKRITDKLPMNHVMLGAIALALPKAKFIYSDRGLLDICVSNFRQIFQAGFYPYSYDFEAIAHHCLMYRDLMSFWMEQFPDRVLKVDYETLVGNPEQQVRRIIDFCELPWDETCLYFHQTTTAVNTPSASQVRKPIYRTSVEQWRRYESHLEPAIRVFEAAGVI